MIRYIRNISSLCHFGSLADSSGRARSDDARPLVLWETPLLPERSERFGRPGTWPSAKPPSAGLSAQEFRWDLGGKRGLKCLMSGVYGSPNISLGSLLGF